MDTRAGFQRLLEDMDKLIQAKRQELSELDERLESARGQLSEKEAKELKEIANIDYGGVNEGALTEESSLRDGREESNKNLANYIRKKEEMYKQQLNKFLEEFSVLESINQELLSENGSLKQELNKTKSMYDKLNAKSHLLSENLDEAYKANFELNLRLAKAESESQMQQALLKKSHQEDEILMNAFNDKLESLKKAIEWRDQEIKRLRLDNQFTLESLGVKLNNNDTNNNEDKIFTNTIYQVNMYNGNDINGIDGNLIDSANKQRVFEIVNAFREKDLQIEFLKNQLLQATNDLEKNANLLEQQLTKNQQTADSSAIENSYAHNNVNQDLFSKYKLLESEIEVKDKQLYLVESRNHYLEMILPDMISDLIIKLAKYKEKQPELMSTIENLNGQLNRILNELNTTRLLLNNIDQLKNMNEVKDAQIAQLVKELNQMDAKFSRLQQNDFSQTLTNENENSDIYQSKCLKNLQTLDISQASQLTSSTRKDTTSSTTTTSTFKTTTTSAKTTPTKDPNQLKISINNEQGKAAECQEMRETDEDDINNREVELDLQSIKNSQSFKKTISNESQTDGPEQSLDMLSKCLNQKTPTTMDHQPVIIGSEISSESERSIKTVVNPAGLSGELNTNTTQSNINNNIKSKTLANSESIRTALNLKTRLRQLENENELLELAMKEILLSLKWSDAHCSTILIDCPSLERLCQLIEARFLAKSMPEMEDNVAQVINENDVVDSNIGQACLVATPSDQRMSDYGMFQMIVLKSELDLLRGQNEQLRSDIKSQRQDYLALVRGSAKQEAKSSNQSQDDSRCEIELSSLSSERNNYGKQNTSVECQTESVISMNYTNCQNGSDSERLKCRNCSRWVNLTNHLLQCIMKVETRVCMSDEIYMSRLSSLHKLIQVLEKDLSKCESSLSESRRGYYLQSQQKLLAESRLQLLENQMNVHLNACPLTRGNKNLHLYTETKNGHGESIQSLTISNNGYRAQVNQVRNFRMTITLLQSIIGCLQARLNYKDERLHQLESLLSAGRDTMKPISNGHQSPISVE